MHYEFWRKNGEYWQMFDSIWKTKGNDFIQFLLEAGLDVNALNKYGRTMLCCAAEWGNLEIVEFLVQEGADGNVTNCDGSKPLHLAALYGHKDIVKFFLDRGISADSCDNLKSTPLHYVAQWYYWSSAVRESLQEIVHSLVNSNADLNAVNRNGDTPLLQAASSINKHAAELFIKLGADVDFPAKDQMTILHYSCRYGWLDILKWLVDAGCDLNAKDHNGRIPMFWAALASQSSTVAFLVDSGASLEDCDRDYRRRVLHDACECGWLDVVKSVLKRGYDINYRGDCDDTPLHLAVRFRNSEIVEHLLKAGADFNIENSSGKTAFRECIKKKVFNFQVVKLFIENGAYFQTTDYTYSKIIDTPILKESILRDMELCTQAVINYFNHVDLPKIYKISVVAERLPPIERLKIASNRNVSQDIAENVKYQIETKGYCDLSNVRPIVLSNICIKSLVENYGNVASFQET